jgi:hypothetical protein
VQAFELNAKDLGLSTKELADVKLKLNWETVDMYFYSGRRLKAIKTALQYSHIQIPLRTKLWMFIKLLTPNLLIETWRKRATGYNHVRQEIDIKDLIAEQIRMCQTPRKVAGEVKK